MRVVRKQLLLQVLRGAADTNIRFDDLRSLPTALGFVERVKGSHPIFAKQRSWRFSIFNHEARWPSRIKVSKFGQ